MNESCAYRKQYVDVVAKMDTEGAFRGAMA